MPPSKISGPNRNSRISMIERECGCGIGVLVDLQKPLDTIILYSESKSPPSMPDAVIVNFEGYSGKPWIDDKHNGSLLFLKHPAVITNAVQELVYL